MKPAGRFGVSGRGHAFGDGGGESDDVVFHVAFDLQEAIDGHGCVAPQQFGGFTRDLAGFGQRLGRGELDLEPLLVPVLVAPHSAHLRAGITGDHCSVLKGFRLFSGFRDNEAGKQSATVQSL